jgi:small subunit ribosomal protein S2
MAEVGIRELLEAGVHFGHQTRRWNPKMRRFIFGERSGIYIIDLLKTQGLLDQAQSFADQLSRRGGTVLFVGTKKQARDGIKEVAEAAGMPYVNHRWLGGLLTNYQTISNRIKRLHDLERYQADGQLQLLPTRERLTALADLEKLQANLGGVKNMQRVPDAMFVVDLKTEAIAVREAQRLRIPIIGLVDTNCDPDGIDYVIPGNDDAIKACNLIAHAIGDVVAAGRSSFRQEEEQARREAEEQARRDAEERRRLAEEQAAREAEQAAAETALTQAGEGEPRNVAEAQVAEAVQRGGRRRVEGRRPAEAGAAAVAADEPASAGATGNVGPGRREAINNPNVGDRVPQEAGAGQAEGTPASDTAAGSGSDAQGERTAGGGPAEPSDASRARERAAELREQAEATPAPEPGPSRIAQAAEAAVPPTDPAREAAAADSARMTEEAPVEHIAPADEEPAPEAEPEAAQSGDDEDASGGGIVDTAQNVAAGAARGAEAAADTVAGALPGPLGGVARAAAGAAERVAEAVESTDDENEDQQ